MEILSRGDRFALGKVFVLLLFTAVLVPHRNLMGVQAQVLAPVAPTSPDQVPAEILDLYNFVVQTGGQLIIHIGQILSNYLDTALTLSIQSISKREAESPMQSLLMAMQGNGTNRKIFKEQFMAQNPARVDKLKAFQKEMAQVEMELETIIGEANLLQWLGAVHAAKKGFGNVGALTAEHQFYSKEQQGGGDRMHFRQRRQTTLGTMQYSYVIATSLQTLFSYLKASLGQFTYLSSQLLNLYQVLPVQPG